MKQIITSLLLLLLTAVAGAENYTSSKDSFSASFPGAVAAQNGRPGVRTYLSNQDFLIMVLEGPELRSRYETLKLMKTIAGSYPGKASIREIHQGAAPGLDVSGIDAKGNPMLVRIFSLPKRTYVIICSDFDLGAARKFADSFRLLNAGK